jgi:hypothetical protein
MTAAADAFSKKHDMAATTEDVARIKRHLSKFYEAVELIDHVRDGWIQLHDGEAIRKAFAKQFNHPTGFDAALAMAEMPSAWSTKYRASVAYHLAPLLSDVVNS